MQSVAIFSENSPFYCPFCGHQTLHVEHPFDGKTMKCPHLLYVGTNEGELLYENEKMTKLVAKYKETNDTEDLIDIPIEDGLHFSLCACAPSTFEVFLGYYNGDIEHSS